MKISAFEGFLGGARFQIGTDVDAEVSEDAASDLVTVTLRAKRAVKLTANADAKYDDPQVFLEWTPDTASTGVHFLAYQCAEFALPIRAASTKLEFDFFSRPGFTRPHSTFPLFCFDSKSGQCLLLAPLDSFHEQVLAANVQGKHELHWGWAGELASIPEGFTTTLGGFIDDSPRNALFRWGKAVRERNGVKQQQGRYADVSTGKLSMWTDNGASYWYRTEANLDLPSTLERTVQLLGESNIPIASVELDSWFYEHEIPRKVCAMEYPDVVPPTGMMKWEPRGDVLGVGGVTGLRRRLQRLPLVLHSRHISSRSPYLQSDNADDWWVDRGRAHPQNKALWCKWMQQAADWGATCYEQDWLVEIWQGVRQLRQAPGRIAEWQRALDSAAQEHGVKLLWCMATPADFVLASTLNSMVAIRTSDDYRYADDASRLWRWHLTVNCLARALGLWPFKDVFISHSNGRKVVDVDGDPNRELEALLSALSAGPVGIGDRMGRTDKNIVMRTCRADGTLVKPDVPLCAMDISLRNPDALLWADTYSGAWRYVVTINATPMAKAPNVLQENLSTLCDKGKQVVAYNWKTKSAQLTDSITVNLSAHEWDMWVLCPVYAHASEEGEGVKYAIIGDCSLYATMGDRRIRVNEDCGDVVKLDVVGEPGEEVVLTYWVQGKGVCCVDVAVGASSWTSVDVVNLIKAEK